MSDTNIMREVIPIFYKIHSLLFFFSERALNRVDVNKPHKKQTIQTMKPNNVASCALKKNQTIKYFQVDFC